MSEPKKHREIGTKKIVVRNSNIHGRGVFARSRISIGEKIAYFEGYEIDHKSPYSLTLGGRLIEPTGFLRHLNHSCAPNSYLEGRWLFASRDIIEGEEILIDYLATEKEISEHFQCNCGAKNCRSSI